MPATKLRSCIVLHGFETRVVFEQHVLEKRLRAPFFVFA
jgi:hypothetical protein